MYWYQSNDTYEASGTTSSSSGKLYTLAIPIPSGFPAVASAHVPHLSFSIYALYGCLDPDPLSSAGEKLLSAPKVRKIP